MFFLDAELQQIGLGFSSSLEVLAGLDLEVDSLYQKIQSEFSCRCVKYLPCMFLLYFQSASTSESVILECNLWCCHIGFCPVWLICAWL